MSLLLILIISVCISAGVLLVLSRELFRMIMGLAVLGMAVNLVVFLGGRPGSLVPAIIETGSTVLVSDTANPLPQALVLTAIVIGFALLCFALVLAATVVNQQRHTDITAYQDSEPTGVDKDQPDKPSIMEAD